tara:strand:- start:12313 stop:15933 length:3621 start_codon:yes stop_codon:yes gene_type:complete
MGNIIGESLDDYVGEQIQKRQEVYGSGTSGNTRSIEEISYLNSRTAWVKLASGTSMDKDRLDLIGKNNPMLAGVTPGSDLAEKNVLFGGTSKVSKKEISHINKKGIEKQKTTSILDQKQGITGIDKAYGLGGTDFGFSPMPGITDVSVQNLNRGSLKKATINIKAHNRNQLDVIDALYMRLGYTVLLEWGNDKYYTNPPNSILTNMGPTLIEKEFFKEKTDSTYTGPGSGYFRYLDQEKKTNTYTYWLPLIEKERRRSSGNYDALFGIVSNFNWSFESDGSYNIQIILMSMGDVMESFKIKVPSTDKVNIEEYINTTVGLSAVTDELGEPDISARKLDFTKYIDNFIYDNPTTAEELDNDPDHDVDESSAQSAGYYYFDAYGSGNTSDEFGDASEEFYLGLDITGSEDIRDTYGQIPSPQFTAASRYRDRTGRSIYDLEVFEEDDMVNNNHWFYILDAVELWDLVHTSGIDDKGRNYEEALKDHIQELVTKDEDIKEYIQSQVSRLKESKLNNLLFNIREISENNKSENYKNLTIVRYASGAGGRTGERKPMGVILNQNVTIKEKIKELGFPSYDTTDIIKTDMSISKGGNNAYYIRLGVLLEYLEKKILFKISPGLVPYLKIDYSTRDNIMYTIPNQLSTDPRICLIQNSKFNKGDGSIIRYWDGMEKFVGEASGNISYGKIMNIYVNFDYIEENLGADKNLSIYRFLSSLCNDINSTLGSVNNLEPVIDELTNTIKIIDQTPIPGIEEIIKTLNITQPPPDIPTLEVFGYNNSKSNFVRSIGLKTEITKEYATMITLGATAAGYVPGEEATAFSKWNTGIEDRFKKNLVDGDSQSTNPIQSFEEDNEAIKKNYYDYLSKDLLEIIGLNPTLENNKRPYTLNPDTIDTNSSSVLNFNKYLQTSSSLSTSQAESSVGFLPFNLNITMDGISGIKIYNKLDVNTSFLPSNYPETLKFIITSVDHKLSNNGWETSLSTLGTNKGRIEGSLVSLGSLDSTLSRVEQEVDLGSGDADTIIIDNEKNNGVAVYPDTIGKKITVETLLKRLNPSYRGRFKRFLNEFIDNNLGYTLIINATYRTLKDSARLKKENNKNASPGKSAHNYGVALDFNLRTPKGKTLLKKQDKEWWIATGIVDIAIKNNLQWGGNFSSYKDNIHFYIKEWTSSKATSAKSKLNKVYGLGNNPSLATYISKNPDGMNPKIDLPNVLS